MPHKIDDFLIQGNRLFFFYLTIIYINQDTAAVTSHATPQQQKPVIIVHKINSKDKTNTRLKLGNEIFIVRRSNRSTMYVPKAPAASACKLLISPVFILFLIIYIAFLVNILFTHFRFRMANPKAEMRLMQPAKRLVATPICGNLRVC